MAVRISLAGNPNSGKTTIFNALTGSSQRVGNWPGVTVERKDGKLKGRSGVIIQDLPGIYSLSPYTLEEVVSRNYLVQERPDALINIVDAANLERNLYLTSQLLELGIPTVIALNMMDAVRKRGDSIDAAALEKLLGCPVIEMSAVRNQGCNEAAAKALALSTAKVPMREPWRFSEKTEAALEKISRLIADKVGTNLRYFSVKLFERDAKVAPAQVLPAETLAEIDKIIAAAEKDADDVSEAIIAKERYDFAADICRQVLTRGTASNETVSDKIDKIITNRFLALPIFALLMFMVYYISISTIGTMGTDWINDELFGRIIPDAAKSALVKLDTAPWLMGLVVDGIIGGVGAVLGFLPQMLMLFLCLSILEDCGYMSRVAFVMDRLFRSFGLSGKSFIPMLIGTGCSVPGIMASRTIENEADRRMTVITTSFIPCGAKLPVIALIAGAFFDNAPWVVTSTYFTGIAAVIISGIILKKCRIFAGEPSPFIMELPAYHRPLVKSVLRTTFRRGWSFVKKAATIILLSTVVIWLLENFNWKFQMVDASEKSMLASLGNLLAPLFSPLGCGNWKAAVATITGLIAKENVVSTLGVLYGFEEVAENGAEYWEMLHQDYSRLGAYCFLLFNLLCAPCFAAMGAVRREMMSGWWTCFAIAYQTVFAFAVSFLVYQTGMFFSTGKFVWSSMIPAIVLLAAVLVMIFRKNPYAGKTGGNAVEINEEKIN